MATARNMKELTSLINKQINDAMKTEVSRVARNTLKENVISEVYEEYTPEMYQRTGGLFQDENIETIMVDETTLSIRSTRHEGNRDIAAVIEYGENYSYPGLDEVIGERPFHAETARELDEKGIAKKALVEGLRRQGLKTK
ncbi:hypothetical protein CHH83_02680 [Bacillus sp. 7586-K]|nr:hypothetical protein CHH83_02680 [Bacillus sp. 7586-K]